MYRANHECPLFTFSFRSGLGQSLHDFTEVDTAADKADFVWVHLDLSDAPAQAWLRRRPWPIDVIEMVAAPIQRGRLFVTPEMVYGHLRDFRDEPDTATLQAGSLCVVASRRLLVTGRRIPLRSVNELRSRVEARTIRPESPFGLITEFFRTLNDIGEGLLQQATEQLRTMESKVLKRNIAGSREEILEMRREAVQVARDMAYKRTAMLEWRASGRSCFASTNLTALTAKSIAMPHWSRMPRSMPRIVSSYSKNCGRRSRRKPTQTYMYSRCSR